jgi:GNAT superfamily N-acetyltransferase
VSYESIPGKTPELQQLILTAQQETFRRSYQRDWSEAERLALQSELKAAFDNDRHHIFVFCRGHEKLGYYWFVVRPPGTVYLLDIFVFEPYRGQGNGSRIFDEIVSRGRSLGMNELRLTVSKANPGVLDFYLAQGLTIQDCESRENIEWCEMQMDLQPG